MKIVSLFIFSFLLACSSQLKQMPNIEVTIEVEKYKDPFEGKRDWKRFNPETGRFEEVDTKNDVKPDIVISFLIENTNHPKIDSLKNFSIRGTVQVEDPRTISRFVIHGFYGKLIYVSKKSEQTGHFETLKIFVPHQGSKKRFSYIFTQTENNPKRLSLNPEVINNLEKEKTKKLNHDQKHRCTNF